MTEPTNAELAGGRSWCVAGGWAACPQLAGDQDVWVFIDPHDDNRLTMLENAREEMLSAYPAIEAQASGLSGDGETAERYIEGGILAVKVGLLGHRQIMLTDAKDIQDLMSAFDVSTHQCAIDEHMNFIAGPGWTPITETPKVLRQGGKTDSRIGKITERYRLARRVQ